MPYNLDRKNMIPKQMGWYQFNAKEFNKFAFGKKLIVEDDEVTVGVSSIIKKDMLGAIYAGGHPKYQLEVINLFNTDKDRIFLFLYALAYSCILIRVYPHRPLAINICGEEGSGKTLALKLINSAFSKPNDLIKSFTDDTNQLLEFVAKMGTLPPTIENSHLVNRVTFQRFLTSFHNPVDIEGTDLFISPGSYLITTSRDSLMDKKIQNLKGFTKKFIEIKLSINSPILQDHKKLEYINTILESNHGMFYPKFIQYVMKYRHGIHKKIFDKVEATKRNFHPSWRELVTNMCVIKTTLEIMEEMKMFTCKADDIMDCGYSQVKEYIAQIESFSL